MKNSESGQMLLPMLALLFLFGMLCVVYVNHCRRLYWELRIDTAADLVALSAAREEARLLNYIAGYQIAENGLLQKAGVHGVNVGAIQISFLQAFNYYNEFINFNVKSFKTDAYAVAAMVAFANGADRPPVPDPRAPLNSYLQPQAVKIIYFYGIYPVGFRSCSSAYYARTWSPGKVKAQPPHKSWWWVSRRNIRAMGRARLWLDADPHDPLVNGGFPSNKSSFLRSVGVQCFYPQFTARRMPK